MSNNLNIKRILCEELKAKLDEAVKEKAEAVESITEKLNSKITEYEDVINHVKVIIGFDLYRKKNLLLFFMYDDGICRTGGKLEVD